MFKLIFSCFFSLSFSSFEWIHIMYSLLLLSATCSRNRMASTINDNFNVEKHVATFCTQYSAAPELDRHMNISRLCTCVYVCVWVCLCVLLLFSLSMHGWIFFILMMMVKMIDLKCVVHFIELMFGRNHYSIQYYSIKFGFSHSIQNVLHEDKNVFESRAQTYSYRTTKLKKTDFKLSQNIN